MRPIAIILATALATATNHRNHLENSALKAGAGKRIAVAALLGFVASRSASRRRTGRAWFPRSRRRGRRGRARWGWSS